jgi:hypothetical protein
MEKGRKGGFPEEARDLMKKNAAPRNSDEMKTRSLDFHMRKHPKGLPGRRNLTLPSLAPIIIPLDNAVFFGMRPLQDHAFLFLSQANEQEAILTGQGFAKVSP